MISLYRGDLHKVSTFPRQWIIPKSQIPLSVFRNALGKRTAALEKLVRDASFEEPDPETVPVDDGEPENIDGRGSDVGTDDGVDHSGDTKRAEVEDPSERTEEESRRRLGRKRKREEDARDARRCVDSAERKESAPSGGEDSGAALRGKCEGLPEPLVDDSGDEPTAMDCDAKDSQKNAVDTNENMPEAVRIRFMEAEASPEVESSGLRLKGAVEVVQMDVENPGSTGKPVQLEGAAQRASAREGTVSTRNIQTNVHKSDTGKEEAPGEQNSAARAKEREVLEARLEKLRAEKHHFVLKLKQVLNEEELKKRVSLSSDSPAFLQGAVAGQCMTTDLEEGELEYARTPSPPVRAIPITHATPGIHVSFPPPMIPVTGRQTSLSQLLTQNSTGRGGYYVQSLGIPASPGAPIIGGGAISPGAGLIENPPSHLGGHSYSHNLALQHAASIHAQKPASAAPGLGQFNLVSPKGGPLGIGTALAGGPPGFSGYNISPSVHSHHSHLSQSVSSPLSHIMGQPGVGSPALMPTPRVPPGYHDMRSGGGGWIQR